MIILNTALFAVVCAAALWPRETLKQLIVLDYSIGFSGSIVRSLGSPSG